MEKCSFILYQHKNGFYIKFIIGYIITNDNKCLKIIHVEENIFPQKVKIITKNKYIITT